MVFWVFLRVNRGFLTRRWFIYISRCKLQLPNVEIMHFNGKIAINCLYKGQKRSLE